MLTNEQLEVVQDALKVAAHNLVDHANNLKMVAERLRAGDTVFPFANGEAGATAAEYMVANYEYRAQQFDDFYQVIDDILYP